MSGSGSQLHLRLSASEVGGDEALGGVAQLPVLSEKCGDYSKAGAGWVEARQGKARLR